MTEVIKTVEVRKKQFVVWFKCDHCQNICRERKSHFDKKIKHFCSRGCYSENRKTWSKDKQHRFGTGLEAEEREKRLKARSITNKAINRGELTRMPCELCGEKAEAHHDDYDKPLEVRWLCFYHHRKWHKENPELLEQDND